MTPSLTVTIAISTLGEGLARIHLPAPVAGLDYLVLLQAPQDTPRNSIEALLANRNDVSLVELSDIGLSNSRNAGLERAGGELVLFSDDDVLLDVNGIFALRDQFAADPELVLAAGWRTERLPSNARSQKLTRFNSGRICAPEFMVRKEKVNELGVRFDTEFGLGARYGLGEDYVFVADILRARGAGLAIPVAIGSHPHTSTGEIWNDADLLTARGAVIHRAFGKWALLWSVFYIIRHRQRFRSLWHIRLFFSALKS
ncbi:hypothetical protein A3753_30360 [Sulfitobacter sp. HI0082]|nr:hypothetical protein A3753_31060 [Sulfitobacter sp. HI0082]KZZ27839.1 hypothetical protein A3753_30360 [Sulfitobacter sp. HI0082]